MKGNAIMTNKSSARNIFLDLFKFFLSYLVIAIHLAGETYDHFPLYRLAVPMFFMISGYFNYSADKDRLKQKAVGFIKRTWQYLAVGFSIYIIFDFVMCLVENRGVGYYFTTLFYEDFLLEFFFLNRPITYTGAQLWFLIAMFVVSLIHYLIVKFDRVHYYKIIIPACYLIYFFFSAYMCLFQKTDMPVRYTRNAFFLGLPNFALGFMLARFNFNKRSFYKYIYLVLGLLCFNMQIREYEWIKSEYIKSEMYVSGVLAAAFLLLFFLGLKKRRADFYYKWVGKNAPFYIYILHMAVSVVLSKMYDFPSPKEKTLSVFVASFLIYEVTYLILMGCKKIKNVIVDSKMPQKV